MNINELKLFIQACDLANDTALIEGVHGIGKSECVKQYGSEQGYHVEELFLSMMDTGDLIGIPRTRTIGTETVTSWAAPDWFQHIVDAAFPQILNSKDLEFTDSDFGDFAMSRLKAVTTRAEVNDLYCEHYDLPNDRLYLTMKDSTVSHRNAKRAILFLDELNRSNLDVRQACMQLILNKELHSHRLPHVRGQATMIVAAINPADDYQVDEMDPALMDRFAHAEATADAPTFLSWGRASKINPAVLDFIAENPDRLHWTPADNGIGSTPRSWAKLAAFMDNIDRIQEEIHFPIMKGKIGSELAGQFLSFFKNYAKVVKMEDIEAIVTKAMKRDKNPESIAKKITKLIDGQEAIQKTQLAESLYTKYMEAPEKAEDILPLLSFLYALELEVLNAFLKNKNGSDFESYIKLAGFDGELNNKRLFTKITTKVVQ